MRANPVRGAAWLSVLCAPLSMAMAAAFCTGLAILHEVAGAVQRSQAQRRLVEVAHADCAAESALGAAVAAGVPTHAEVHGGLACEVQRQAPGWLVRVAAPDGERWYRSRELMGAAPAALDDAAAAGADGVVVGAPALDPRALAGALRGERCVPFVRDAGIALLHCKLGTDRDDFTLGSGPSFVSFASLGELVVIPGHLWIPPGPSPLQLQVDRDTVVVARGNLYIGRSVRVHGAGRLLLVAAPVAGASVFADRDGDGRWSPSDRLLSAAPFQGPLEGAGSAYFAAFGERQPLELGCGVVACGAMVVGAETAVAGPLVTAAGVARLDPTARLRSARTFAFRADRERVPGFLPSGAARPALLEFLGRECPAQPFAQDGKQPLYLAGPTR